MEIEYAPLDLTEPGESMREVVDAGECSEVFAAAKQRDAVIYIGGYEAERIEELRSERAQWHAYDDMVEEFYSRVAVKPPGKGKAKAKVKGTEKKKIGRPKGSKDKAGPGTRKRKAVSLKVSWVYDGTKANSGPRSATIGDEIEHDGAGRGTLVSQPDATHLTLQVGTGDAAYIMTVGSAQCFPVIEMPQALKYKPCLKPS